MDYRVLVNVLPFKSRLCLGFKWLFYGFVILGLGQKIIKKKIFGGGDSSKFLTGNFPMEHSPRRNKTGLQPVSRPVEWVHHFGGCVEGAKSLGCQGFADGQPYRIGGGSRLTYSRWIKVGTKECKTQQTDIQTDRWQYKQNWRPFAPPNTCKISDWQTDT